MTHSHRPLLAALVLLAAPAGVHAQQASSPSPLVREPAQEATASPAAPAPDAAPTAPCDPPRGPRGVMHEQLVLLLNPMGAEHRLELGLRQETGEAGDLLTTGAHVEAGVATAVSPVYAFAGPYLEIQPLSFLGLRAELSGAVIWPIGMSGAGYYGLSSYGADVHAANLPAHLAGSASGWLATVSATLQGALDLAEGWRLVLVSELGLSRMAMGDGPYQYSMKHDLVLAREDTLITSSSFLGVEGRAAPDVVVRFGVYDDLRHVPASGYVGHQVGPIAMVEWRHVTREIGALTIFLRGGGYTHHVVRAGEATILGGLAIDYELGGL